MSFLSPKTVPKPDSPIVLGEALLQACREGNVDAAANALDRGAPVDFTSPGDTKKKTPFLVAASHGHVKVMDFLRNRGANVQANTSSFRYNALHLAVKKGHLEAVKYLIPLIDLENETVGGWRSIHLATSCDNPGVLTALLDAGAELNAKTRQNHIALSIAVDNRRHHSVSILLDKGSDPNYVVNGTPMIMSACRTGDLDTIKMLVEKGHATVMVTDPRGNTPLDIADQHNMSETALYLWQHGCESAAYRQASDIGRLRWSRPCIINPPSARFGALSTTIGSKMFIFGGVGVPRGTILPAPDAPISESGVQTTVLSDMYMIDFEKTEIRNLCHPNEVPLQHRNLTLSRQALGPDLVLSDDLLTFESAQQPMDCLPSLAKASEPFRASEGAGLCYFEVLVIHPGTRRIVSIGLVDKEFPNYKKHPGWLKNSYGYHGDDGSVFHSSGRGRDYSARFEAGDVVGCGINFATREVFFTRNGEFLGITYKASKCTELWAACAVRNPKAKLRFNFGTTPFKFGFRVPALRCHWIPLPSNGPPFGRYGHMEVMPNKEELLLIPSPSDGIQPHRFILELNTRKWRILPARGQVRPLVLPSVRFARVGKFVYMFQRAKDIKEELEGELPGPRFYALSLDAPDVWLELMPRVLFENEIQPEMRDSIAEVVYRLTDKFQNATMCAVGDELLFIENDALLSWNPITLNVSTRSLSGSRPVLEHFSVTVVGDSVFTFGGWSESEQVNDVYTLNLKTGVWYKPHQTGAVPQRRNHHSCGFVTTTNPIALTDTLEAEAAAASREAKETSDQPGAGEQQPSAEPQVPATNNHSDDAQPNFFEDMFEDIDDDNYNDNHEESSDEMDVNGEETSSLEWRPAELSGKKLDGPPLLPLVPDDAAASSKQRFRYLIQGLGWNGVSCIDDIDILALEPGDDRDALGRFVDAEDLSDVTLEITSPSTMSPQVVTMRAHRVVLASRSDYFRSALEGSQPNSTIQICAQPELFRALVGYLYSDVVDVRTIGPNYRSFIETADKFAPNHVNRLQEEYLLSRVTTASSMGSDLRYAFELMAFSDVTFVVGSEEGSPEQVHAHSVVLAARSQYFNALFLGGLRTDRSKDIHLPDVSPVAFRQVLQWFYTGDVDFEAIDRTGSITDLFALSHRFQAAKLAQVLEDVILYSLDPSNTVSVILLAEQQNADSLRRRAVDYLRLHQDEVSSTPDFMESADIIATIVDRYKTDTMVL